MEATIAVYVLAYVATAIVVIVVVLYSLVAIILFVALLLIVGLLRLLAQPFVILIRKLESAWAS
jgi:hypothetical protein